MERPSFQFYPASWKNNAKLRRCSEAARGVWLDVLCLLHDMEEYGVCRWTLNEVIRATGSKARYVKELVDKGVLKGADHYTERYTFTPRHAGKAGEPVVLVSPVEGGGPCWFCSRFVRDEYIRKQRGKATRFSSGNQPFRPDGGPVEQPPEPPPKGGIGERHGDGPSSSSSSSIPIPSVPIGTGSELPGKKEAATDPTEVVFGYGVPLLVRSGVQEKHARSFLGGLCKNHAKAVVAETIARCCNEQPVAPLEWLAKALPPRTSPQANGWAMTNRRTGHKYAGANRTIFDGVFDD